MSCNRCNYCRIQALFYLSVGKAGKFFLPGPTSSFLKQKFPDLVAKVFTPSLFTLPAATPEKTCQEAAVVSLGNAQ